MNTINEVKTPEEWFAQSKVYSEQNDTENAIKCCLMAAEQGHTLAQYEMGDLCTYGGGGVKTDPAQGFRWYLKAAEQGYAEAQNEVGKCYTRER